MKLLRVSQERFRELNDSDCCKRALSFTRERILQGRVHVAMLWVMMLLMAYIEFWGLTTVETEERRMIFRLCFNDTEIHNWFTIV